MANLASFEKGLPPHHLIAKHDLQTNVRWILWSMHNLQLADSDLAQFVSFDTRVGDRTHTHRTQNTGIPIVTNLSVLALCHERCTLFTAARSHLFSFKKPKQQT